MATSATIKAEIHGIQAKLANLVEGAKAAGRLLTDAECTIIEQESEKAIELKAQLIAAERGEKSTQLVADVSRHIDPNRIEPVGYSMDGPGTPYFGGQEAKGYLNTTPAGVKALAKNLGGSGIKAVVAAGSSATAVELSPEPIRMGSAPLSLLDVIQVTRRNTPKYSFLQQSVRTSNAAVVEPGALKPTSTFTVKQVDGELKVYAHLSEYVDKYLLEDADSLSRFLEGELTQGVLTKVQADAVAAFAGASGVQSVAFDTEALRSIYKGVSALETLSYDANLIVLNPTTYANIVTTRNTSGAFDVTPGGSLGTGAYAPEPVLFNRQVVLSSGIAANKALVLQRDAVGISTDRQGIRTEWDSMTGFDKNQVRARTEGRFAFDVFQPAAIASVTIAAA